jgi:transcriptional regulator with XRE-family HTH domain
MPRPSKQVAPDTLGGRLRAARQAQHLSLAEVAASKYSTSLISQIERNRVDPSTESLQFLAQRLKLPFDELLVLARQHRESETEAVIYKDYEERYAEITRLLAQHQPVEALHCFKDLNPEKLPMFLRWRTLALRGRSYFEQRRFSEAQRDFQSALVIMPTSIAEVYQLEVVALRLHLAAATRELNQFTTALEYYQQALQRMSAATPLRYIAEAHWGFALVYYRKGQDLCLQTESEAGDPEKGQQYLQEAWEHAEAARILYNSIADTLNSALLQCQMALIEQAQTKVAQGQERLLSVLKLWQPTLEDEEHQTHPLSERANVVSAAACYLAGIECQTGHLNEALETIQLALQASKMSMGYRVRQAEAFMMQGQILEARNTRDSNQARDPKIEQAFRQAVQILRNTDRRAVKIQAHYLLGRYLLSTGDPAEGKREIDKASELAGISRDFDMLRPSDERSQNGGYA